jgi:peptide chain release factor subunit 1
MRASTLNAVVGADGPFASVYLDDSHDTEDAQKRVELEWRALREQLAEHGADEKLLTRLDAELLKGTPPVGRSGRAVVATADRTLLDVELQGPPTSRVARFDKLPYLLPLVDHGDDEQPFLLAEVDKSGLDLFIVDGAGIRALPTAKDEDHHEVHKAHGHGFRFYAETQASTEDVIRARYKRVAEEVAAAAGNDNVELVVLVGEVQARAGVRDQLPVALRDRVVDLDAGSRAAGSDHEAVLREVASLRAERRIATMDDRAERFRAETGRGSGLAVSGIDAVQDALEQANVEVLLVTDPVDRNVRIGDVEAPADETLPYVAVSIGAELIRVDERLELADGFGALLRHT